MRYILLLIFLFFDFSFSQTQTDNINKFNNCLLEFNREDGSVKKGKLFVISKGDNLDSVLLKIKQGGAGRLANLEELVSFCSVPCNTKKCSPYKISFVDTLGFKASNFFESIRIVALEQAIQNEFGDQVRYPEFVLVQGNFCNSESGSKIFDFTLKEARNNFPLVWCQKDTYQQEYVLAISE